MNALYSNYKIRYTCYNSAPSESKIYSNLNSGWPVYSAWQYSGGYHATVICGINSLAGFITVMDPESGFVTVYTNGLAFEYTSLYTEVKLKLARYASKL